MPLRLNEGTATIGGVDVALRDFPVAALAHLAKVHDTRLLEASAVELRAGGFASTDLASFIRAVCKWGGYPGIAGRVIKHNSSDVVRSQFLVAHSSLIDEARVDGAAAALRAINRLWGLGTPSFASKHLRFIEPALCPVLDHVVSGRCGYPFSPDGYAAYSFDCLNLARALEQQGVSNPMARDGGKWFAADIDMVVFATLQRV